MRGSSEWRRPMWKETHWEYLLGRLNRVIGGMPLEPKQELALFADVLPYVRIRKMRKREAWVILVWNKGMQGNDFEKLWAAIRPPKRRILDVT